ncbi:MAG: hypothetical protein PHS31_09650 [Victivallaceae bacterium]|nr:hypothetical protein [Victivallaceae bacterium]
MKSSIVKSTFTNYCLMLIRLVEGVLISRWIIAYLGLDSYGLWTLLWSFFGYSRLLDFGMGVTALKYTAVQLFQTDIKRYNGAISTIFSFYSLMAVVVIVVTYIASFFVVELLKLDNASVERIAYCRTCFLAFGIGAGLVFPTGIFPGLLIGLQKIYLRNYVNGTAKIIELIGVLLIFHWGGELLSLIIFILTITMLPNLIMLIVAGRLIPGFKLRLRISPEQFKEIFMFSGFVYLCAVFRIIGTRSGTLLISIFSGLESVGIFQMGERLPMIMFEGSDAYHENIGPIAANLHASGQTTLLAKILTNSIRWNSFLTTGFTLGLFWFAPQAIRFLFNVESAMAVYVCRVTLGTLFTTVVFRSVIEKFMLMTNRHAFLSYIIIAESITMLVLYLLLLPRFGFICVAWTAFVVKLFMTVVVVLPFFIKYLKTGWSKFLIEVLLKPTIAAIPTFVFFYFVERYYGEKWSDFALLATCGIVGGGCYITASYFIILAPEERIQIKQQIDQRFKKFIDYWHERRN